MGDIFDYQFIVPEFVLNKANGNYYVILSFVIDEEQIMMFECKDHDQDVDKLIARTVDYLFRNFFRVMEYTIIKRDEDNFEEINLRDYLSGEMLVLATAEYDSEFNLLQYVEENKLNLVDYSSEIH